MNLQLDHFSDVIQKYLKNKSEGTPLCFSHTKTFILPLDTHKTCVEHGSHNVSRWMTWLSISLKNAAACDKWYQLQNLSITESLNANGAWEKLFVSHPRACHTQCRTNKNPSSKKLKVKPFFFWVLGVITKSPSTGEAQSFARGRLAWCLLCGVWQSLPFACALFTSREAGAAKRVPKKKHCASFFGSTNSYLVYRPEHGRTTRRT